MTQDGHRLRYPALPGIATTVLGATRGDPEFAPANPVGGIAVQTLWVADASASGIRLCRLWFRLAALGTVVAATGYLIGQGVSGWGLPRACPAASWASP